MPLRVLIIEDSEDDALLSVHELRRGGYEVVFERVETAGAMIEALKNRRWDVILADYTLPHFGGHDALRLVKEERVDLPFIFVSGTIGEDTAVATMKEGAHDYILKGNLKRLVPAVERELREAEVRRERSKLEEQLRQAQKMETIGHLAGGIAHDFNNILSAIIGYADLTLARMRADDPLRSNVEHVLESARKAAVLTHSLLAFSRKQPLNPSIVNLNDLLKTFKDFFLRLIRDDIELKMILLDQELPVLVDAAQLEQAMINLVTNACDAMSAGGLLTIETQAIKIKGKSSRSHGDRRPGNYGLLSITDTGIGMDEKTRGKIFEPFFTTKEVGKGTGLGLAMVYGIIQQHEGFIEVDSEPGTGTTIDIYLPLAETAEVKTMAKEGEEDWVKGGTETALIAEDRVSESGRMKGGTETLLIAEDDDALRELLHVVLEDAGYRIITSVDGEDAIRKFTENRNAVQLFIGDVIMPRKNGAEAYKEIKAMRPDIKAIFVSGYTEDILGRHNISASKVTLVHKPFSPEFLLRKVREVLDGESVH